MRINHIIIGCQDVVLSASFYSVVFGFEVGESFVDTGTGKRGRILHRLESGNDLDILLVPFDEKRLPNPQHVAFEVEDLKQFQSLFTAAEKAGYKIRAKPPLNTEELGVGRLDIHGGTYRNFYVLDPSGVNIEVMCRE